MLRSHSLLGWSGSLRSFPGLGEPCGARRGCGSRLSVFQAGSGQLSQNGSRTRVPGLLYKPWAPLLRGRDRVVHVQEPDPGDPLCSFLGSCGTMNERSGPNSCAISVPVCSPGPWSSEDGSGDEPDAGASAVHHGLRILRQPPHQRDVLRLL